MEAAGREAMDLISQNQELLEAFTEAWQCIAWISTDLTHLTICLEDGCEKELAQQFNIRGQNVDMIRLELKLVPVTSQACICRELARRRSISVSVNHFLLPLLRMSNILLLVPTVQWGDEQIWQSWHECHQSAASGAEWVGGDCL